MSYTNSGPAVTTGDTTLGQGSPWNSGVNNSSLLGFYGVTPVVRPANANQAALTLTTGSTGGIGFTTTTAFTAFIAQLENIRSSLVTLGLLKGSA